MVDETGDTKQQYDWQTPKPQFEVGRVLQHAFKGLFANLAPLVIGLFIVVTLNVLMSTWTSAATNSAINSGSFSEEDFGGSFWLVTILSYIILMVTTVWFQLLIVQTTYNRIFGMTSVTSELLKTALRLCLPMTILALLYTLVCTLGFYAFLIGFFFVWPGWALLGPVYLYETETSFFGSFGRAWELARGYKRWIFLILLIVSIVGFIIWSIIFSMMIPLFNYNVFDPASVSNLAEFSWRMIGFSIVSSIAGFFVYGLYASGITASYAELKIIRGETSEHLASVFD